MKRLIYIFVLALSVGCYEDDSHNLQSENASHRESEMSILIKSVTAHHATFDDKVDNSNCFSIDFPYQLMVNDEMHTILSKDDLTDINQDDDIEIIYPISTTFFNYDTHQALNQTEFNLVNMVCTNDFDLDINTCLDIQYPIIVNEYNNLTESFDTFLLEHDKDVFLHFENLHDNDIYEIDYPVYLIDSFANTFEVNSNEEFIDAFYGSLNTCE